MKQRASKLARAAASLLLLSSTSGCSFIFVRPPPSDGRLTARVGAKDCTSSKLAPGFDTAFGALELVRTGMAAGADDSVYENPNAPLSREADIALGVGFTALFVSSAIYGFVNTSRCSRIQHGDDHAPESLPEPPETWGANAQQARPVAAPPPLAAPPPPVSSPPPPAPASEPPSDPGPSPAPESVQ